MTGKFSAVRAAVFAVFFAAGAWAQQPVMRQYKVSQLPAASANNGVFAQVSDGANPLDCSTGGGSLVVACVSNGTNWIAESAGAASATTLIMANAAATGTTLHSLAKATGAPSTAVIAATSDTGGILGVVISGAGTSGSATIETYGLVSCTFDGTTTAGDYVQASTTTGGDCHDTGSLYPTSGQVLGRVLSTNAAAGLYQVYWYPTEIHGFGAGSVATKLLGSASITPTAINDGACAQQGTTIALSGAAVGDPVSMGVNAALVNDVDVFGKVTAANVVTVEVCNLSGASYTPPAGTYSATIVH